MMQINKGLVMETSRGFITVMTNQGEFLSIPWSKGALPDVGKEVEFEQRAETKEYIWQRPYFSALAASIALILLFIPAIFGLVLIGPTQVVAYINVDINPSLELGINKEAKVIETAGLNDDGKKLLENVPVNGLYVQEAIEKLTAEAVAEKFLEPEKGNNILITVASDKKLPAVVSELDKEVQKVLQEKNIVAATTTVEVPKVIHNKAREANVSTGKYVVFMEAVEEGLEVSLDDLREKSISTAINEAGGEPEALIQKAREDKERIKEMQQKYEQSQREKQQAAWNQNTSMSWGQQNSWNQQDTWGAQGRGSAPEVKQDDGRKQEYNAGGWPKGSVAPSGEQKNNENKENRKNDDNKKAVQQYQWQNPWQNNNNSEQQNNKNDEQSKTNEEKTAGTWPPSYTVTSQQDNKDKDDKNKDDDKKEEDKKEEDKKEEDKKNTSSNQGRNPWVKQNTSSENKTSDKTTEENKKKQDTKKDDNKDSNKDAKKDSEEDTKAKDTKSTYTWPQGWGAQPGQWSYYQWNWGTSQQWQTPLLNNSKSTQQQQTNQKTSYQEKVTYDREDDDDDDRNSRKNRR